jgi:hypothetical protein
MKTIVPKASFILLSMLFCTSLYSQNIENKVIKETQKEYNLPPGVVFGKKFNKEHDLSFKIDNSKKAVHYEDSDLRIAKQITKENLESFKEIDVANYNYYSTAFIYFDSLSEKVRNIYTKNELWYIYVFDQELKTKIQTIK